MNVRRWILNLLLALTVLCVLLVVASIYLLVAHAAQDSVVVRLLTWTVGAVLGGIVADLTLLVIIMACERVLQRPED